jgi:methylmalonyl-CoA decarboxylase
MAENPTRPVRPTQIANNIGIATISNPPVNSLSSDVCDGLLESFDEFEKAPVRVVIIGANPNTKIWSAGHDIREIPLDGHDAVTWTTGFERVLRRVRNCRVPVIAMLHSSVWGAACDLAVTCDLAIGTPKTTFAITPVKLGISYKAIFAQPLKKVKIAGRRRIGLPGTASVCLDLLRRT